MTDVQEPHTTPSDATDELRIDETSAELAMPPELVANTLGGYIHVGLNRIRTGDSGVLPVIAGLIIISALFQYLNSSFLTAGNIVNLLILGAVYMVLAMGEIFA